MSRASRKAESGPLADRLDRLTVEGVLAEKGPDGRLTCVACGHRCVIPAGRRGICKVRFNRDGRLRVPHGYAAGIQCDPTEKKPFYHVMPGSNTLTFGMLGCDLHCSYCQNWLTSQALRDPEAGIEARAITAEQLVSLGMERGAGMVASSYNEPLITAEWAVDVFKAARRHGLRTAFVSNGNGTPDVLDFLRPWTDCYKIDLKTMSDRNYRSLGGVLRNILDTVEMVHQRGFWMEIVTLVIPGWNDSEEELRDAARFLARLSPAIPWHVTAFHRDYRMTDPDPTSVSHLLRAVDIGRGEGLQFVYAGNLPGRVGSHEDTRCPACDTLLVARTGFRVTDVRIAPDGTCPSCDARIPGIWDPPPQRGSGAVEPIRT